MSSTFVGYCPNFCEYNEVKFKFNSVEELLGNNPFKWWSEQDDFVKFCFTEDGSVSVLAGNKLTLLGRAVGSVSLASAMEKQVVNG